VLSFFLNALLLLSLNLWVFCMLKFGAEILFYSFREPDPKPIIVLNWAGWSMAPEFYKEGLLDLKTSVPVGLLMCDKLFWSWNGPLWVYSKSVWALKLCHLSCMVLLFRFDPSVVLFIFWLNLTSWIASLIIWSGLSVKIDLYSLWFSLS